MPGAQDPRCADPGMHACMHGAGGRTFDRAGVWVQVREQMEGYKLYAVVPFLVRFIDRLTNIYVRYNRRRLKGRGGPADEAVALATLFDTLLKVRPAPLTCMHSMHTVHILVSRAKRGRGGWRRVATITTGGGAGVRHDVAADAVPHGDDVRQPPPLPAGGRAGVGALPGHPRGRGRFGRRPADRAQRGAHAGGHRARPRRARAPEPAPAHAPQAPHRRALRRRLHRRPRRYAPHRVLRCAALSPRPPAAPPEWSAARNADTAQREVLRSVRSVRVQPACDLRVTCVSRVRRGTVMAARAHALLCTCQVHAACGGLGSRS